MTLTAEQHESWTKNGFVKLTGFTEQPVLDAMIDRITEIARSIDAGQERPDLVVVQEDRLADRANPEDRLSKIFRLMRSEAVFRDFATDPRLLAVAAELLGPDVDCFLSQFIFKHPGALGQPWHQDNFYFRLKPTPQLGVWLACTAATVDNGPLWIAPGSHVEDIHNNVVKDPREGANAAYVEIVGADVDGAEVVLMEPGDVLLFHSHLRHMSTDNNSSVSRAAMVYHYADAAAEGYKAFNNDWAEVLRGGEAVQASAEPTPVVY